MWCKIFLLFVTISCYFSNVLAWSDCGSEVGSIVSLSVSDCDNTARCILKRNSSATIDISFTTNADSDVVKIVVYGVILSVPIPFELPNSNACVDCGISCPIKAGQTYNFKSTLPILSSYPRVTVDVKWVLKDKDDKEIVCGLIPAKIK